MIHIITSGSHDEYMINTIVEGDADINAAYEEFESMNPKHPTWDEGYEEYTKQQRIIFGELFVEHKLFNYNGKPIMDKVRTFVNFLVAKYKFTEVSQYNEVNVD